MKPRNLLIVAVVFGILSVAILQVDAWRSRGGAVIVFRATRAVEPGNTLAGAVERATVPANTFVGMSTQVPTAELEQWVTSSPVVRPIRPGETITFDALQKTADSGLKIPPGMRAVGLEVSAAQSVGYLVRPGDIVDVLATVPDIASQTIRSRHILQAKRVLAVDQQYRLEDSAFLQKSTYSTVTLEVTPSEAEIIEANRSQARSGFTLSLRGRGDMEHVQTPSVPLGEMGKR
jgi:Flp pilus assembly protein CpaB